MADDKVNVVPTEVSFVLPRWAASPLEGLGPLLDVEARMALVLQLAAATVTNSAGGPFAAALFTLGDGRVIAAGVNLVLATRAPVAHAEIVAIALAGSRLGTHDLAQAGPIELVTSCEPCAMCMGALPWAGVSRVVCGARRRGRPRRRLRRGRQAPRLARSPAGAGHRGRAGRGP